MMEGCHISTKDGSYAQIHIHPFQDKAKGPVHSCTLNSNKYPLTGKQMPLRGNLRCCLNGRLKEYKQIFGVVLPPFFTLPPT